MAKNREKQKVSKQEKIIELQKQMRQAYKNGHQEEADKIMDQIRSIRNGETKVKVIS